MSGHPFAELVEQIAERERKAAVKEGDYVWALICAVVEQQARASTTSAL
jgi:hypothetical protein